VEFRRGCQPGLRTVEFDMSVAGIHAPTVAPGGSLHEDAAACRCPACRQRIRKARVCVVLVKSQNLPPIAKVIQNEQPQKHGK
jgi:hypothetical protein